jgi:hypothetical protein
MGVVVGGGRGTGAVGGTQGRKLSRKHRTKTPDCAVADASDKS